MAAENIFVNTNSASLGGARCVSLTNNQQEAWKNFVVADQRNLNLYFTDGAGAYVSLSGYSVRAGVGGINKRPTGGTWTFTHGGYDHTFQYNTSAETLETALDAAPFSLGVSVAMPVVGVWIVKFDAVGAQSLPTTDASALTPDSSISAQRLVTGDGTTKEEWILRLFQVPWAYTETWSSITNGVNGTLNFGTENLYKAMAGADSVTGHFEVELTDASGNINTVIQAPVAVVGQVIGDGVAGVGAFNSYLDKTFECMIIELGGEASLIGDQVRFDMPYAMTLTEVKASTSIAPSNQPIIIDVDLGGVSVFSSKSQIDVGDLTSVGSASPSVISTPLLTEDTGMSISFDQVGTPAEFAGGSVKVYLLGHRT